VRRGRCSLAVSLFLQKSTGHGKQLDLSEKIAARETLDYLLLLLEPDVRGLNLPALYNVQRRSLRAALRV
jgi:hypothetical protein